MSSMNALICTKPGELAYAKIQTPIPAPGEALVRIKRVGICGTDLHAFEGTQPYFNYPRILGHELSGELVAAPKDCAIALGSAVTILPYFNCGKCIACRNEKPNCCTDLKVCGVHQDGGLVEYLSVPATALVHEPDLGLEELAMVEPLAIGAHGVRRANVQTGEYVLVIGAGPIGLATMLFAQRAGGNVIALDVNETRLAFCKTALGIAYTLHARDQNLKDQLLQITGGDMPTVVIDATGSLQAISAGFEYLAHGGRYVLIGLQKGAISFSHPEFHKREATLLSSRNATRADFEKVLHAIKTGQVVPTKLLTKMVAFGEAKKAFPGWIQPESGIIKAMVNLEDMGF